MKRFKVSVLFIAMFTAFAIILTACGGGGGGSGLYDNQVANKRITQEQKEFLSSNPGLTIKWNPNEEIPYSIRGFAKPAEGDSVKAALSFLEKIKGVFRIKDPASEMSLRTVQKDDLGYEHVRFCQKYQGLLVVGSELIVHINDKKQIYQVNGQYHPDIAITTAPMISSERALSVGVQEFQKKPNFKVEKEPELVVYPSGVKQYVLAYHYVLYYDDLAGDVGRWVYYVDANTGESIEKYNDIKYFKAPPEDRSGSKKGSTGIQIKNPVQFLPTLQNNVNSIAPPTTNGTHTNITGSILTGEGGVSVTVQGWYDSTNLAYYLYNKNLFWYIYNVATSGYTDSNTYAYRTTSGWGTSDRAEMSAGQNFHSTQNYFKTVHSRNSFDNNNAYARGNVHQGTSYVNAYWDGTDFHFGDGDGSTANPLVTLDIVAHEYGHAWTDYTSDLIYQAESGALNESFSDIIGAVVEFYVQPDGRANYPNKVAGTADWLTGEDCWLSSTALRDMRSPSNTITVGSGNEQPSYYHGSYWYDLSGDNGGVHYNSGVQNFLFYLLSEGGSGTNDGMPYSVTGIGVDNTRLVAYRTNSNYLTSSSTYAAARGAWISAATDLNPAWVSSVQAAWDAVGIIDLPNPVSESFEGASLPSGWTTGGNANWSISTTTAKDGSQSIKPGTITHSQSTYVQRTVTFPAPGTLSFFIRASSELGYDFAEFYVDGVRKARWSGTVPWTSYAIYLGAGSHTFKWQYVKDSSVSSGSDTVWVDAVTYVPEAPSGLSATTTSSTQIDLTWTDNSSGEAGFKIERKTGAGGTYIEIATVGA
ncbi:MAG: M4 family metallopeptidase, partial [Desulfobacteria bacterium]